MNIETVVKDSIGARNGYLVFGAFGCGSMWGCVQCPCDHLGGGGGGPVCENKKPKDR